MESDAAIDQELINLHQRIDSLDLKVNNSVSDISQQKKILNEQSIAIDKIKGITDEVSGLKKVDEGQNNEIARVQNELEKSSRTLHDLQNRLDGTTISQIPEPSYEAMRATVKAIKQRMDGEQGVSFDEIQNSYSKTKFLGSVLNWLLGIVGVGGFITFLAFVLGTNDRPSLQELKSETDENKVDIVRLEKDFAAQAQKQDAEIRSLRDKLWELNAK